MDPWAPVEASSGPDQRICMRYYSFEKEKSMFQTDWPKNIRRAFFETWVQDEGIQQKVEERISAFAQKWGGIEVEAFKRALQNGQEWERIWALFALGYLTPTEGRELLLPFIDSPRSKERWASAIAL